MIESYKIAVHFVTRNKGCLILYLILCLNLEAFPYFQESNKNTMEIFYENLAEMANDSSATKISKLKDIIIRFPAFERCYLQLYEMYITTDQISEAKRFFSDQSAEGKFYRNSQWMLAKVNILEKDPQAAYQAFTSSLRAATPTVALLIDFLTFDLRNSKKYNDSDFIKQIRLNKELKNVFFALVSYLRLDLQNEIKQFSELPTSVSNQLPILYAWGYCYRKILQGTSADSLWQIGLKISREQGDSQLEAKFLMNLGNIYRASQSSDKALAYYDSSYVIARRIGDLPRMATLAGNRGVIQRERGQYSQAEVLLFKAIQLSQELKSSRLADWYSQYGYLLTLVKRFDEALKYYNLSEELAKKSNRIQVLFRAMINKGELYGRIGLYELARTSYQNALTFASAHNWVGYIRDAREGLADIFIKDKKYNKARKIYLDYISSSNSNGDLQHRSYWFYQCGLSYLLENDLENARYYFQQAYELAKKARYDHNMIWAFIYLAHIDYLEGKSSEASKKYQFVFEKSLANKDTSSLPLIYLGIGKIYRQAGEIENALSEYMKAINIIEKTRLKFNAIQFRVGYFVNVSQVYDEIIDCYYQLSRKNNNPTFIDSLYHYLSMTQARSLKDLKLQKELPRQNKVDNHLLSESKQVIDQLKNKQRYLRINESNISTQDQWDKTLNEIEILQYSLIEQRLRILNESLNFKHSNNIPEHSLSNLIYELKKQNLCLLSYHITKDVSFVLAITSNEIKAIPIKTPFLAINSLVDSLITPLHFSNDKNPGEVYFEAEIAYQLYEILIKPAEDLINHSKNLVIVPDVTIMNLPFEMLLYNSPDKVRYTVLDSPTYAKHFLLQKFAFIYSPTPTLLTETSNSFSSDPNVLILANPINEDQISDHQQENSSPGLKNSHPNKLEQSIMRQLTGWRTDPLPFADVEAKKIKEIASSAKIYNRSAATESSFKDEAEKYDIIYFATHGFVDYEYDAFSGLVLATASDTANDGLLMGYEISDLKLNCDLIIMSACETARGKIVKGEGVMGLPRLFLSAGAKSVLMTLWKVDDWFASELMPEFYNQYHNNNLSTVHALAKAKRILLNKKPSVAGIYYQHPLFWASFTLFGNPGQKQANFLNSKNLMFFTMTAVAVILISVTTLRIQKNHRVS